MSSAPHVTGLHDFALAVNRGCWEKQQEPSCSPGGRLATGSGAGSPHPAVPAAAPARACPCLAARPRGGGAVRVSGARGDGDVRPAPLLPADAADPRSSWPRRRSAPRPTRAASAAPRPWPTAPAACWRAWTSWSSGEGGRRGRAGGRASRLPGGARFGWAPLPRRARACPTSRTFCVVPAAFNFHVSSDALWREVAV